MSLRLYLLFMLLITALCWLTFGYVVWTVNPETTNYLGFTLFYLSLFLALSGTAALIGFLVRFVFLRHELAVNKVKIAFRQSFLFAGFIVVALFLLSRGLLTWLNSIILIVGLSALEFFLLLYLKPADNPGQENQQ
ncbi:MAG: hypothetical protein PHS62_03785 [Patescibacteria group bacterium]|nr:hypothetical protein [Patescibacteria group bacterium]